MLRIYNLHMGKLYSRIPKSFYIVPYNEQYETRDFVWFKAEPIIYNKLLIPTLNNLNKIKFNKK